MKCTVISISRPFSSRKDWFRHHYLIHISKENASSSDRLSRNMTNRNRSRRVYSGHRFLWIRRSATSLDQLIRNSCFFSSIEYPVIANQNADSNEPLSSCSVRGDEKAAFFSPSLVAWETRSQRSFVDQDRFSNNWRQRRRKETLLSTHTDVTKAADDDDLVWQNTSFSLSLRSVANFDVWRDLMDWWGFKSSTH